MIARITVSKTYCIDLDNHSDEMDIESVFDAQRFARAMSADRVESEGTLVQTDTAPSEIIRACDFDIPPCTD